ncbi:MAG: hypothetical protein AAFX87_01440 [Bacteroidota bacterium]
MMRILHKHIYWLSLLVFLMCCGDDEAEDPAANEDDPSLEFTIGSDNFVADFSGFNAAIIATTNPGINWTSVTLGGSTTNGETVSFVIAFDGKNTGTSTVSGAAGEDTNAPQGLSIALVVNNSGQVETITYEAVNMNIDITNYVPISGITAEVAGTFSGTMRGDNGQQVSVSGSFKTGTL